MTKSEALFKSQKLFLYLLIDLLLKTKLLIEEQDILTLNEPQIA